MRSELGYFARSLISGLNDVAATSIQVCKQNVLSRHSIHSNIISAGQWSSVVSLTVDYQEDEDELQKILEGLIRENEELRVSTAQLSSAQLHAHSSCQNIAYCMKLSIPCVSKKTIHFWNGGQIKNIRFWGEKIICMDSLWTQLSYDTKPLKIIHAWMSTAHSCKGYGN